ncbi:MAG: hypothetical protein E7299_10315 [Lachnospiraceae bacterium]|nr:hypothetical protein [Lachnospiraceae bacterium]
MDKDEIRLYHQIQKNTQMMLDTLDVINERIYDKNLSIEASREFATFADISNRALKELTEASVEGYAMPGVQEVLHRSGIQIGTIVDNSTTHMADMLMQEQNREVNDLYRKMKASREDSKATILAKELAGFEEKNIERLKNYL